MKNWPYPFFMPGEVGCKCGCGMLPRNILLEKLTEVRHEYNDIMIVTSAARCATHNRRIGGAADSAHVHGLAADVLVHTKNARRLLQIAMNAGFLGVGVDQKLNSPFNTRYLHLDLYRETIWSY